MSDENAREALLKRQIIQRFPGISYAWVNAANKEAAEYFGFADKESHTLVDENTVFPACSISKYITALCVMKLHEQKTIDVEAPVNQYLQQWKYLTADGSESTALIRTFLCHTAGCVDGENSFYGLRRSDSEIDLTDILEGRTTYNNRSTREEKPHGTAFEYSDAGYCVLQLMLQELMGRPFEDIAEELVFDPLRLENTFFASRKKTARLESRMAAGYDGGGLPIPGKFPDVPDLAASGLWSTPKELLMIAKAFAEALHGGSAFLRAESAREMAEPVRGFPWTGLGVFRDGEDILVSKGWGENGQCILKMNIRTKRIAAVMTNRNPGVDQAESGIESLADRLLNGKE